MGKALKVIAPIAIGIGIGFATGGIGAGVGFSAATTSAGAAAGGGFFSGFGFNLSTLFKGLSALSSIAGGIAAKKQAQLEIQQEKQRARLARLQALQLEARVVQAGARSRGAAIAQAAAQGRTLSGRDFFAFMNDQEDEVRDELGSIRVNASVANQVSSLRIRQFGLQGTSALVGGIFGAGRSLFELSEKDD